VSIVFGITLPVFASIALGFAGTATVSVLLAYFKT
jgi:hypothetical protein